MTIDQHKLSSSVTPYWCSGSRLTASDPKSVHGLAPQIALLDEPAQVERGRPRRRCTRRWRPRLGKQPHARLIALGTRPERGTGITGFPTCWTKAGAGIYVQSALGAGR